MAMTALHGLEHALISQFALGIRKGKAQLALDAAKLLPLAGDMDFEQVESWREFLRMCMNQANREDTIPTVALAATRERDIGVAEPAFFEACRRGKSSAIPIFLDAIPELARARATWLSNRSGIMLCALGGHRDIFNTLLARGADLTQLNNHQECVLTFAAQCEDDSFLDFVVDHCPVDLLVKRRDALSQALYRKHGGDPTPLTDALIEQATLRAATPAAEPLPPRRL